MAAGVYITAVSDRGLERVLTIHLPLFLSLSHFLFPLSHCLFLLYPCCKVGKVNPLGAPPATPQPLAQFVPREGLTILGRTIGTDPPLFGPPWA